MKRSDSTLLELFRTAFYNFFMGYSIKASQATIMSMAILPQTLDFAESPQAEHNWAARAQV